MVRLESHLEKWLVATKIPQTYKDLTNLLVREQFLSSCDVSISAHLREKHVDSNSELAKLAERYMDAHGLMSLKTAKVPKSVSSERFSGKSLPKVEKNWEIQKHMIKVVKGSVFCVANLVTLLKIALSKRK